MNLSRHGDVALLTIDTGKANAISAQWLARMNASLDEALATPARALVITGHQGFFCAGLDLLELAPLQAPQLLEYIALFNATMLRLFELPIPVIAAVNGHAPAGGCVLALQADLRLMAEGKGRIGLTEVPLGIGLPAVVVETLRFAVPATSLVPIALEGRLFSAQEAQAVGLVQEVTPPEELVTRALAHATRLAALPAHSLAQVKAALRRPTVDAIRATGAGDAAQWVSLWFSPQGQAGIRAAIDRLRKK